jgi:hypothetical protein
MALAFNLVAVGSLCPRTRNKVPGSKQVGARDAHGGGNTWSFLTRYTVLRTDSQMLRSDHHCIHHCRRPTTRQLALISWTTVSRYPDHLPLPITVAVATIENGRSCTTRESFSTWSRGASSGMRPRKQCTTALVCNLQTCAYGYQAQLPVSITSFSPRWIRRPSKLR